MLTEPGSILINIVDSYTIISYSVRIVEKLLVIYFLLYFCIDIFLFIYSLIIHRKQKTVTVSDSIYEGHAISIIVPAYNEEVSIVSCVKMLAGVDYPDFEIIVVNDGSKDDTLQQMLSGFNFTETATLTGEMIRTNKIRKVYKEAGGKIILIDKENGGKADSVNVGINYSSKNYICTIDADSILDGESLKMVILPMIKNKNNIVTGGFLAASNGLVISGGKIVNQKMPRNIWVLWQIVEYIKSFMIARLSLSRLNMLLIMSGAFSLYKKDDLLKVGGLLTSYNEHPYIRSSLGLGKKTVCEDMEIVIRLWRYYKENRIKGRVSFLPQPVCWTEVPENSRSLFKQRARWHQGLGESLKLHRKIIFEPAYGVTGLLAMPYYLVFEFFSPFVKIFSLVFLIVLSIIGVINAGWMLLLLISVLLITTIIMSVITVILEAQSKSGMAINRQTLRYNTLWDWLLLLFSSIAGSLSYEFFKMFAQLKGTINLLLRKNEWNKFARKGIKSIEENHEKN